MQIMYEFKTLVKIFLFLIENLLCLKIERKFEDDIFLEEAIAEVLVSDANNRYGTVGIPAFF